MSAAIHPFPHTSSHRTPLYFTFNIRMPIPNKHDIFGKTKGKLNKAVINMYVKFYTAGNHMVETQRCDSSFQIFPNLKMGYAGKSGTPIDVNCSRLGQVSVTRHSRRMLLQTLSNS